MGISGFIITVVLVALAITGTNILAEVVENSQGLRSQG
jgi:hypothetical protein